jgi:hypothetical protein
MRRSDRRQPFSKWQRRLQLRELSIFSLDERGEDDSSSTEAGRGTDREVVT